MVEKEPRDCNILPFPQQEIRTPLPNMTAEGDVVLFPEGVERSKKKGFIGCAGALARRRNLRITDLERYRQKRNK